MQTSPPSSTLARLPCDILRDALLPLLDARAGGRLVQSCRAARGALAGPRRRALRRAARRAAGGLARAARRRKWRLWRRAAAARLTSAAPACHRCGGAMSAPEHFAMRADLDGAQYVVHHFFCGACWRGLCRRASRAPGPGHPRRPCPCRRRGARPASECCWTAEQSQDFVFPPSSPCSSVPPVTSSSAIARSSSGSHGASGGVA